MMCAIFLTSLRRTRESRPCEPEWRASVKLYKRSDSSHWQYDFTVRGKRYRGSTHESNKIAANERMSELRIEAAKGALRPSARTPETLQELSAPFLKFVNGSKLEQKSK